MKITEITNKNINRYFKKNTVKGKYNRHLDTAMASSIAFGIQILRIPFWQIPDVGITAGLGTLAIKCFTDALKIKKDLTPIKKRAMRIKDKNLLA